jgi:hypothetical protein
MYCNDATTTPPGVDILWMELILRTNINMNEKSFFKANIFSTPFAPLKHIRKPFPN